jgi:3'-5' exoribonuclease 1
MNAKMKAVELKKLAKREQELKDLKEREEMQAERDKKPQPYDYYLICDVEATCQEGSSFDFENEIIEFPVILIDGQEMKEIDVFHAYVKPSIHPELSEFCSSLTGISQETVDNAQPFYIVYEEFKEWLNSKVSSTAECMFVTDGPWGKSIVQYPRFKRFYGKGICIPQLP